MANYDYECMNCGVMEVAHGMNESIEACPECGLVGITKLISVPHIIHKGLQANQYAEVKRAKYWRDADGNRHRVTAADGHYKSATVPSKRTRTDKEVAAIKKKARAISKQKRSAVSYSNFKQRMRRAKR